MKRAVYIGLIAGVFGLAACQPANTAQTTASFDLKRLVGRWESVDEKSSQIEEWMLDGNGGLRGKGFVLTGGDTTFIEFLSIGQVNNVLTYQAQVSDQNQGTTIPFTLTEQSGEFIEFSNPKHDFPKRIVYRMKGDTALQAYIEGPRENRTVRITFDYLRSAQ